jgi:hypothetical protein
LLQQKSFSRPKESLVKMPKPKSVVGDEAKERIAARLVAVSEGSVSVPQAMKIVKMPTPVRTNDTVRKRVHRKSQQMKK